MLMVISPAKDLDFSPLSRQLPLTQADFLPDAAELTTVCRALTPADLSRLMHISDKLAGLNAARFSSWQLPFTPDNAKAALFAFNGDVYQGLQAQSLTDAQLHYAQQHLRILSGLYGVLRPLDLMQPYRLEMGTSLTNPRGKDLYQFWGSHITENLNQQLEQLNAPFLLNLASQEYFKAVKVKQLAKPLINVQFKDQKNGQYKIISFFAKKARGLMARYVIEQKADSIEALQQFCLGGYRFNPALSKAHELVFLRDEADVG
ncbi:MAG: peroxide stress protein YaaA [Rheinheimera sp.]|nr:peroxide stress protein YaaA [Rheinheimera sp.]